MKLASHNSWSYLPVRKWWMRPLNFIAKCQAFSIITQYYSGVRMFDLRVRWCEDKGIFVLAHGIVTYDGEYKYDLLWLDQSAYKTDNPIYIRVLLEDSGRENFSVDAEFAMLCHRLQKEFKNLSFIGGWPARKRWRQKLFDFGTEEPSIDEQHVSVSGKWWQFVPERWAKKNNERVRIIKEEVEIIKSDFLMLDFI